MEKGIRKYSSDQLYLLEGKGIVLYEAGYYKLFQLVSLSFTKTDIDENLLVPFITGLNNYKMLSLFCDKNGNIRQYFTRDDLKIIIQNMKQYDNKSNELLERITRISSDIVEVVSILMGLNICLNSNNKHDLAVKFNVTDVVIEAQKLDKFKEAFGKYIISSLIYERTITLTKEPGVCDFRINRSLGIANIAMTDSLAKNRFKVTASATEGFTKIAINNIPISELYDGGRVKSIKKA